MTPGSPNGFSDAPLPVGATWANPLGTMKITVDWADGGAAQVTIASTIVRVAVPDVRGETVADARAILQAVGLRVGSTANVVDPTCNNIGLVTGQNPTTGTVVVQGSAVNLSVGKAPSPPRSCQ
jgi:beta-lactam-binding protein with PASTA domain